MIRIESSKSSGSTEKFLTKIQKDGIYQSLHRYGQVGADALAKATPMDSGLTSESWTYKVIRGRNSYSIVWSNTNTLSGANVAVLLQYGHATGTGGWVKGYDYINPALKPLFDKIAADVWKEVTSG